MLLLLQLRFLNVLYVFLKIQKRDFLRFLLCFTRFLELCCSLIHSFAHPSIHWFIKSLKCWSVNSCVQLTSAIISYSQHSRRSASRRCVRFVTWRRDFSTFRTVWCRRCVKWPLLVMLRLDYGRRSLLYGHSSSPPRWGETTSSFYVYLSFSVRYDSHIFIDLNSHCFHVLFNRLTALLWICWAETRSSSVLLR